MARLHPLAAAYRAGQIQPEARIVAFVDRRGRMCRVACAPQDENVDIEPPIWASAVAGGPFSRQAPSLDALHWGSVH